MCNCDSSGSCSVLDVSQCSDSVAIVEALEVVALVAAVACTHPLTPQHIWGEGYKIENWLLHDASYERHTHTVESCSCAVARRGSSSSSSSSSSADAPASCNTQKRPVHQTSRLLFAAFRASAHCLIDLLIMQAGRLGTRSDGLPASSSLEYNLTQLDRPPSAQQNLRSSQPTPQHEQNFSTRSETNSFEVAAGSPLPRSTASSVQPDRTAASKPQLADRQGKHVALNYSTTALCMHVSARSEKSSGCCATDAEENCLQHKSYR
jgi:hypothetical protein